MASTIIRNDVLSDGKPAGIAIDSGVSRRLVPARWLVMQAGNVMAPEGECLI